MFGWLATRRRRRILAEPFPSEWDIYIDRNVAIARRLDAATRQKLRELVQVFIAEKYWEGCGGLELTEEMQVTIAAQACLLVLGHDETLYRDVASILVYPSVVMPPPRRPGVFEQVRAPIHTGVALSGEAHLGGPVVLAWDVALAGGREQVPGNVVIHELAHKLDMANGIVDGAPPFDTPAQERRWAAVAGAAQRELRTRLAFGLASAIDGYGATNAAEFFAVATEAYFTTPRELRFDYPELYAELAAFYRFVPPPRSEETSQFTFNGLARVVVGRSPVGF
jgi:MtfA peptidase